MNTNEFFKQCYVTNMDYRGDRLELAYKEIGKLGIVPKREAGVVYTGTANKQWNGWIGCGLCHLNILSKASRDEHLLIFEDDIEFINEYAKILEQAIDDLPKDWCILYLGGNAESPIYKVSEYLGKTTGLRSTHAYAVNKNYTQVIHDEFYPVRENRIIDTFYQTNIASKYPCYITIPMIAIQRSGKSDIEGKDIDYKSWMIERFNNQLKE